MSKQDQEKEFIQDPVSEETEPQAGSQTEPQTEVQTESQTEPSRETDTDVGKVGELKARLEEQEYKYLRLCAEYDNFRKRSQKEKESIYTDAKADAVTALLPVYDNLDRALKQETSDEAYARGVQMTMDGLKEIFTKLGVEEIPALGATFDPALHNAVMHVEDENAGENTVVEIFQSGFRLGERVIRFAMVKVAN